MTKNPQKDATRAPSSSSDAQLTAFAEEILGDCRISLMMALRFMDAALWHMPFERASIACPPVALPELPMPFELPDQATPIVHALMTDGTKLLFEPGKVVKQFYASQHEMDRDMLHAILHCVFRHPFDSRHEDAIAWSLACDVVVESIAIEACGERFPGQRDTECKQILVELKDRVGPLTPFKLYRLFSSLTSSATASSERDGLPYLPNRVRLAFMRDAHSVWAIREERGASRWQKGLMLDSDSMPAVSKEKGSGDEYADGNMFARKDTRRGCAQAADEVSKHPDSSGSMSGGIDGEARQEAKDNGLGKSSGEERKASHLGDEECLRQWEDIGKQMEADLLSYSRAWGNEASGLVTNLAVANRTPCDYARFLRRFCTMAEDVRVNDDEFDYVLYTFGLAHYGNMPLIESLEYQETNRVREFVVALDTSASCSGELIKAFIDRTYQILCESQQFGDTVNVHIVQCDNCIQSDMVIASVDELARCNESFLIKGHGGTDFRPVFDYVNALLDEGEFDKLQGLIYFTDGYGMFPEVPPSYDTAFVFIEEEGDQRRVPPWAMKVVIDEDRLRGV